MILCFPKGGDAMSNDTPLTPLEEIHQDRRARAQRVDRFFNLVSTDLRRIVTREVIHQLVTNYTAQITYERSLNGTGGYLCSVLKAALDDLGGVLGFWVRVESDEMKSDREIMKFRIFYAP